MKTFVRFARFTMLLVMGLGVRQIALAQRLDTAPPLSRPRLSTEEVVSALVRRNLERSLALGAYHGTRIYRLDHHGFPGSRSAEMTIDVTYRAPGTKEFSIRSEKGSKAVIERVFKPMLQSEKDAVSEENQRHVALNNDNYKFELLGYESTLLGACYVLSVEPRIDNKLLYRGRIWVDANDFAVIRIEGAPAKNPSFWTKEIKIEQIYAKVGEFWLPISNKSSSNIRFGGHANFTIEYKDYQITNAAALRKQGTASDEAIVASQIK